MPEKCECYAAPRLIFPCSGTSDVGAISDMAARRLTLEGTGRMSCLAGLGSRTPGLESFMYPEERRATGRNQIGPWTRAVLAVALLVLAIAGCCSKAEEDGQAGTNTANGAANAAAATPAEPESPQPQSHETPGTAMAEESTTSLPPAHEDSNASTVGGQYPHLASGSLVHAELAELPGGVLLRAGDMVITQKDIDVEIAKAPADIREQLRKNAFFLLEQLATQKLLVQEARQAGGNLARDERALLQSYFQTLVKGAQVSDWEIAEFYEKNSDLVGQATLERVKEQIRQYLLQQKQQHIVEQHVQTIARRTPVAVSDGWVKTQAALARDNPVDNARASGKPTFANFGAKGCVPCDMMEPIREALRKKYEGKLNVVFVHVHNDQILASRYGVQGIPLLVFFDAQGNEVFRHTGYFSQENIEEKLAELGLK